MNSRRRLRGLVVGLLLTPVILTACEGNQKEECSSLRTNFVTVEQFQSVVGEAGWEPTDSQSQYFLKNGEFLGITTAQIGEQTIVAFVLLKNDGEGEAGDQAPESPEIAELLEGRGYDYFPLKDDRGLIKIGSNWSISHESIDCLMEEHRQSN